MLVSNVEEVFLIGDFVAVAITLSVLCNIRTFAFVILIRQSK